MNSRACRRESANSCELNLRQQASERMATLAEDLLRAILQTVARQTFPEERLRELVIPRNAGKNQLQAFNSCDGSKTQGEIAKAHGLDAGNFSRTMARWVDAGVVFKLPDNKLLHVYPLPLEKVAQKDRGS